ncbi:caspase domain containing protein [Nitzschia inconspicua]|uniref:Caspase domain containing protein n=1 Tax=Nitzschia inconspicua TaxID=303405 RepID=A0A9K3LRJ6_9STRA|nr:caspase domain containing protein [Nitzschia inconspicua]
MPSSYPGSRNRSRNAVIPQSSVTARGRNVPVPMTPQSEPLPPCPAATAPEFQRQVEALIPAEVRMISGCHSLETSADISNVHSVAKVQLPSPAGKSGGACTSALLSILYDPQHKGITFQQLLLELRKRLAHAGITQIPQLSGSRPLDLQETPFSLVNQQSQFYGTEGTRRALLVGINYYGQSGQLSGCINDVKNVQKYLVEHQGYRKENVTVLADDGQHPVPTREKIIRGLRQLVAQSNPGDSVYFHYSGHGGLLDPDYWNRFQQADRKLKEYDETLYPVDHGLAGQIRDFSLFNHFVKPMAAGVTVTCVMDCCHSGSVLDLPYTYQPTSAGTIRMRQSMDALTNLAFLYILAGGMLPGGGIMDSVAQNLQQLTGESIDNLTGTGMEEMTFDTEAFQDDAYGMDQSAFDGGQWDGYDGQDLGSGNADGFVAVENDYDGAGDDGAFGDVFRSQGDGGIDTGTDFTAGDGGLNCGEDGGDVDCGECDVTDIFSSILEDL